MKISILRRIAAPLLLFAILGSMAGCVKSVKPEDAAYGAAFRKSTEEQTKDAAAFNQTTWKATEQIKKVGKVESETMKALQVIVDDEKKHLDSFAAVKAPEMFSEFHNLTVEFMRKKLDLNIEQLKNLENGEERKLSRMTESIETIGLEYEKKMKAYMEKVDKKYFDQAMKTEDEFR